MLSFRHKGVRCSFCVPCCLRNSRSFHGINSAVWAYQGSVLWSWMHWRVQSLSELWQRLRLRFPSAGWQPFLHCGLPFSKAFFKYISVKLPAVCTIHTATVHCDLAGVVYASRLPVFNFCLHNLCPQGLFDEVLSCLIKVSVEVWVYSILYLR